MRFDPSLYRAYDIRGTYPDVMNEKFMRAAAQAFATVMGAKKVAVGRDVRSHGASLQKEAIQALVEMGVDVVDLGVISTEMLYYASGVLDIDGGFCVTASHNPRDWNGMKFVGKAGVPLTREGKLGEVYKQIEEGPEGGRTAEKKGAVRQAGDLVAQYADYLQKFVPAGLTPHKVVANVNFGANGKVVDAVIKNLPLDVVRLNWNEDGTFPKGTPDPLLPSNRKEIAERIVAEKADFGVAWDADADRCFFYDEKGRAFPGYYINALLIEHFLKRDPGAAVVVEPRQIWATEDTAARLGGKAVVSRTGHGFIKAKMRESNAIFGGENSGHFYYRDFWYCDNGLITFLTVLGIFSERIRAGEPVSALLDRYRAGYPASEEINFITDRAKEIIDSLQRQYPDAQVTTIDGVSLEMPIWRCNLRMSQNEPVLRLNVEAKTLEELEAKEKELVAYIESFGAKKRED